MKNGNGTKKRTKTGGSSLGERLARVRAEMKRDGVDVLLVRSTDRFLNEYVPLVDSTRAWLSGFTGSAGEVILTHERLYLAVDGRYWLQAEQSMDPALVEVLRVPLGTSIDETVAKTLEQLRDRAKKKLVVGFEPDRLTPSTLEWLQSKVGAKAQWVPLSPSPVERARGPVVGERPAPGLRAIDEASVGRTVKEKLEELGAKLEAAGADALLVQRLDDIAYLANLRGTELPYQATFKSIALATKGALFIGVEDVARVPEVIRKARREITFLPENELWGLMGARKKRRKIAFDRTTCTEHARRMIEASGAKIVALDSPVGPMKAKKNAKELEVMVAAFRKADRVVDEAARWLCDEVVRGRRVTEADFADEVEARFTASGATGLSFRVISAAGKNGAIIHYSDPSPKRVVKRGELMLLDTGAYYEEGYATDLTRTFLVDGPRAKGTDKQRYYYTAVLRSAIAGMTAIVPDGARGGQLDAITRAPLWAEGLTYNHGTGHGVGINVHEFPPRIGPNAMAPLEEGFVFSIEPGVYLPSFGGIRIENLCTLEKAPKKPGFLRVVPLTFSPLDTRLIDKSMLTPAEKAWLTAYDKRV
ncbi:M24 family metallopeptidase [Myxococcota bacterium]|nr:M24 family metallopeptidase [Myxococcota bacterium]